MSDVAQKSVIWKPFFKQERFISSPVFEVFYGGARGGGKTEAILGEWLSHQDEYGEHASGIVLRRTMVQLHDLIERSKRMFFPLGARWTDRKGWVFPNGARLRFAYLDRDKDAEGYQGQEYSRVYVEELTNFPSPAPIMKLMATLRSSHGVHCGFRATGNPGGPGHNWVKSRYISPVAPWQVQYFKFINPFTGAEIERDRVFIPSGVSDNPNIGSEYIANLQLAGSPQLVKAWLTGDWSIVEGAFFPEFSEAKHVIPPFPIPSQWMRFRACDWGSYHPFSIGWYAVASNDFQVRRNPGAKWTIGQPIEPGFVSPFGNMVTIPKGALIRYREWYGTSGDPDNWNQGLKLNADLVAEGILRRELDEPRALDGRIGLAYGVIDPSADNVDGGPSIMERINDFLSRNNTAPFMKADNRRTARWGPINGNDQVRQRLVGDDTNPMIYFTSNCVHAIRTLPALPHDDTNPEDSDTHAEDHCFSKDTLVSTDKGVYSFADLVGKEGHVRSHDGGWHVFRSVRRTAVDRPIVKLSFSDGTVIRCTPEHKFLTMSGWIEASRMQGMLTLSCSQTRCRNSAESGTTSAGSIFRKRERGSIRQSGDRLTAIFRRAITFITSIMTDQTMRSRIWTAFHQRFTSAKSMDQMQVSVLFFMLRGKLRRLQNGMEVQRELSGTKRIMKSICEGLSIQEITGFAKIAGLFSLPLRLAGFALTPARPHGVDLGGLITSKEYVRSVVKLSSPTNIARTLPVREPAGPFPALVPGPACLNVKEDGRSDVYCFTVPDTGNFALANGIIALQCPDEIRYACMSRPYIRTEAEKKETKELAKATLDELFKANEQRHRAPHRRII